MAADTYIRVYVVHANTQGGEKKSSNNIYFTGCIVYNSKIDPDEPFALPLILYAANAAAVTILLVFGADLLRSKREGKSIASNYIYVNGIVYIFGVDGRFCQWLLK